MGCPCDNFICQEPPTTTTTTTTTTTSTTKTSTTVELSKTTQNTIETHTTSTATTIRITTTEANSTATHSSTTEKYFKNWRDELFTTKKEFRLMAAAVGFQLIFGFFFMMLCLFFLELEFAGKCEKLFQLFFFCFFILPVFISPIVGFVSLYYEIKLYNDAVLSFQIYQAFAILTTINLSTVTNDTHNSHTITIHLRLSVI